MGSSAEADPWAQVEDLEGLDKYSTLQLDRYASAEDIKRAYRALARRHHPDKGGNAVEFARVQAAFETLSDPHRRTVYDDWARDVQFRFRRVFRGQAPGGEDTLLDELNSLGMACDPLTQLVVTCGMCGRPAGRSCWTCGMPLCNFCTLTRHWKEGFPLHWPLINSDHMRTRLAQRELERKRIEDDQRLALEDPNHRGEAELKDIRRFRDAATSMLDCADCLVRYDLSLARFYMWAQTEAMVYVAVRVPTGYGDKEVEVECGRGCLRVAPQDSPPVLERALDGAVDESRPVDSFRTEDNRLLTMALAKAAPARIWPRLFRGDPDGARCLRPPYLLAEADDDVVLELDVPQFVQPDDVRVLFQPWGIEVNVIGHVSLRRTYWRDGEAREVASAVDTGRSAWSLERDAHGGKVLSVVMARRPLTEDEVLWKRGQRQDNRSKERPCRRPARGFRFFADDEDDFGLEDILQALCFLEAGTTWAPAKPWAGRESREVDQLEDLDTEVRCLLEALLDEEERAGK